MDECQYQRNYDDNSKKKKKRVTLNDKRQSLKHEGKEKTDKSTDKIKLMSGQQTYGRTVTSSTGKFIELK